MQLSDKGLFFLAAHEGIVPAPYLDSVGVWTYGVGHAETSGRAPNPRHMPRGMPADLDAELRKVFAVFADDMRSFAADVNRAVTVPMEQHEFDAAVSFHFNTGGIGRANWVKSWNAGNKSQAAREIMNWKRPPEIIGRRTAEQRLFATGEYGNLRANVWTASDAGRVSYRTPVRSLTQAQVVALMGQGAPTHPRDTPQAPKPPEIPATPRYGGFLAALLAFLSALFGSRPVTPSDPRKTGLVPVPHEGRTIWTTPDYYMQDGIRMPVDYPAAVRIAAARGMELPTKSMVDSIWQAATVKLEPRPIAWTERNTTLAAFRDHDATIEAQLEAFPSGTLTAGHKKDILRADRLTIYGWHRLSGNPIQPVSTAHGNTYRDYSHGLRLVYDPEA